MQEHEEIKRQNTNQWRQCERYYVRPARRRPISLCLNTAERNNFIYSTITTSTRTPIKQYVTLQIPLLASIYYAESSSDEDTEEIINYDNLKIRPNSTCLDENRHWLKASLQFNRRYSIAPGQMVGSLMSNNNIKSEIDKTQDKPTDLAEQSVVGMMSDEHKKFKVINGYLFGCKIGEGSYSKVKECVDTRTLCRRAVKIMNYRTLRRMVNGEEIARREIEVLKRIPPHPNIIRLYSVYDSELFKHKVYLFLDYAACSLQNLLDDYKKPFPAWQLHKYFVQLIDGLEFLHCHNIVHNDVKPANLLLTFDDVLKICDFGSAEILDPFDKNERCKRCRGTAAFQAPEAVKGDDDYWATKLDIWAAGVCLYNLSTGELPFKATNIYKMFKEVESGQYVIPDKVDTSLKTLLQGMMCVDVNKRYTVEDVKKSEWYRKKHPLTLLDAVVTRSLFNIEQGPCPMMPYLIEAYNSLNTTRITDGTFPKSSELRRQQTRSLHRNQVENVTSSSGHLTNRNKVDIGRQPQPQQKNHSVIVSRDSLTFQALRNVRRSIKRRKSSACRVA